MVPEPVRTYLLHDLEAAPLAFARVTSDFQDWDAQPDPKRFSLREAIAHLADWEEIWVERVNRIVAEENPFLPSVDEGLMAQERNYAASMPSESLDRYLMGRMVLVALLRSIPPEAWSRPARREFVGDIDLLQQIAMIAGHDGYHLKQALEYTQGM